MEIYTCDIRPNEFLAPHGFLSLYLLHQHTANEFVSRHIFYDFVKIKTMSQNTLCAVMS